MKTTTDPNGTITSSTYDLLNRLLTYSVASTSIYSYFSPGVKTTYTYDTRGSCTNGAGHICSIVYADDTWITGSTSTTTYQYYPRGQVQTELKSIRDKGTFTTGYTYDNLGNQVQVNQPDGNRIAYNYNPAGLVDSTVIGTSTLTTLAKVTHSPLGQIATIILGSGATTTNTYDAAHLYRLTNKKTSAILPSLATTTLQNLSYTYDSVGNITQIADTSNTATAKTVGYTYDDLNRLLSASTTAATGGDYVQTYVYDPIGNITYKSDVGTYHYDGNTGTNYANPHAVTSISTTVPTEGFVQGTSTDKIASSTTTSLAFTATTTASNLIIVAAEWPTNISSATVSDSNGNTYTNIGTAHIGPTGWYMQLFYAKNITGGADTVTLTTSTTTSERKLAIHEYSGLDTTSPLDTWNAVNIGTGTTATSSSLGIPTVNDLIFSLDATAAGVTSSGSLYALRSSTGFGGGATEDRIATTTSTINASFTQNTGTWGTEIAVFKKAVGATLSTYTYDNNGNLTTVTGTSPATYIWDYNNRLEYSLVASTTMGYAYDQNGQRVIQRNTSTNDSTFYPTLTYDIQYNGVSATSTQTDHFSTEGTLLATLSTPTLSNYNAGTCVFSSTASTTITSNCTVSGTVLLPYSLTVSSSTKVTLSATSTLLVDLKHNKILVKKGGGILIKHGGVLRQVKASDTTPTLTYDLTDHLGSVTLATDASNTLQETVDYYPYGGQRVDTKVGTQSESRKFLSQTFDVSTNLSYLNARYMDNTRGQFVSEDPVFWSDKQNLSDPHGLNSYSYSNNNPVVKKDPTGLSTKTKIEGGATTAATILATGIAITIGLTSLGIVVPASFLVGISVVGLALSGVGTYANHQQYSQGAISKDTYDYNNGSLFVSALASGYGLYSGLSSLRTVINNNSTSLSNDALVVRGGNVGNQTPDKFIIGESRTPGIIGFSTQCNNNCTNVSEIQQLGQFLPNKTISYTTVGTLRSSGGDVFSTPGRGYHVTVTDIDGKTASMIPWIETRNPTPLQR